MTMLLRLATALLLALGCAIPAQAAVTITFWSHELGNSFPHAFFSLRGTVDATGAPVDANYGFTAKSVSPTLLMGTVRGRLDISKPFYIATSDAQFSYVMTDAQYADILGLVAAWDEKTGDAHYDLNHRNCVHFVQEAARRLGLVGLDHPRPDEKAAFLSEGGGAGERGPGDDHRSGRQGVSRRAAPATPGAAARTYTGPRE